MAKLIFVTGGVVSGIGKGISAASVGRLLKDNGYSVFMQKFDPYLNVDPGTMSPYQHGEVFVTGDGSETDLDLGHYERFIDEELTRNSSVSSGQIYNTVIHKERAGEYGGVTVQVIPHVTNEIKEKVYKVEKESGADFIITEIGGTAGDIESQPFFEAIRQIHSERTDEVLFIHNVLIPAIPGSDELKTKPAQHSFKTVMSYGIKPDIFILRAAYPIPEEIFRKISLFCDLPREAIIESKNVDLIYEVPNVFRAQGLDRYILNFFHLEPKANHMDQWQEMCDRFKQADQPVRIKLVGKYTRLADAYMSVYEALYDAGYNQGCKVTIDYIDSETLKPDTVDEILGDGDGLIIPGGFGDRGIPGMVEAVRFARDKQMPYLGICLGMQIALIETARNVLGYKEADSTEFNPDTRHPVIHILPGQQDVENLGGTLRLGNLKLRLKEGSRVAQIYGQDTIVERHRHRYEFNNAYREEFQEAGGVSFSGLSDGGDRVEVMERPDQPFFVACQYHPEFKSRPNRPHPLFMSFIAASHDYHRD